MRLLHAPRIPALLLCLCMAFGALSFSACRDNDSDGGSKSASSKKSASAVSVDSGGSGAQESAVSSQAASVVTGGSVSSVSGGKPSSTPVLVPKTDEEKWGTEKGLASAKKVPAWMRQIPSGKIVSLGSAKMAEDTLAYQKTLFKSLTGKDLVVEEKIVAWSSLRTQLQTMVLADSGPDVFGIYNGVAIYLRNKGLTRNFKDYINMNDAAWKDMKSYSEPMFYKGELTGVAISSPLITGGFLYNKTLIAQAGLEDPWALYKKGKWDITKFLTYVEELTVDNNHDGVADVYGVSMAPEDIFKMSLSSGEDLVKLNSDGTFSNNLRSATFTRWASYAKKIKQVGSYDTESWTRTQRFLQNTVALSSSNVWGMSSSKELIAMKKANKLGWVPFPKDAGASVHRHFSETSYVFLPKNSKNPKGAAAYYYMRRYASLNPNAKQEKETREKYLGEYGWTAEEYEFQKSMTKSLTPVNMNWAHVPDFNYQTLWKVFTDDWSTVVEDVYPKLDAALKAQNK